ncbi:VWA domain-containing protein [Aliirhizobium terrae]|uniref:vWA domain-containing protein n=1 Tax=Terrirhizobium terrae TaxID=2926709 RepID=UPI0025780E2E|nr:VWA domain-containing protein [Rhizobium sp. CC-CFT758]WJH41207.1 VWA domain-containing protein [Rhizobium sp. CC-CFT758]
MMTAILLPVLIGVAGLAMDTMNLSLSQNQLQQAADGAALAVSAAMADGTADATSGQTLGKNFVSGQVANYMTASEAAAVKNATNVSITTTTTGTGRTFAVVVSASASVALSPFSSFIGGSARTVTVTSNASSGIGTARNGVSMELVLDQSGSMTENTTTVKGRECSLMVLGICLAYRPTYVTKMEALKQAATALFDALDKADPTFRHVRTGAISYANGIKGQKAINWGTADARGYVSTLVPAGGTDATAAVDTADKAIRQNIYGTDAESVAQAKYDNKPVDRIIVLMTDGQMEGDTGDWLSSLDQSVRAKCASAKEGGIRIFTVAFMAPDKGKSLLQYCASSASNYYEPTTMDALIASFADIGQKATKVPTRLTN